MSHPSTVTQSGGHLTMNQHGPGNESLTMGPTFNDPQIKHRGFAEKNIFKCVVMRRTMFAKSFCSPL